jgi:hypothetical protein
MLVIGLMLLKELEGVVLNETSMLKKDLVIRVRGTTCFGGTTGEWRRLHNKELYALYSSPNVIQVIKSRRLRWAGHVARMGERRGAYRALVGKPEGRRPLGRPRRRWEDNIKMNLREVEWGRRMD